MEFKIFEKEKLVTKWFDNEVLQNGDK